MSFLIDNIMPNAEYLYKKYRNAISYKSNIHWNLKTPYLLIMLVCHWQYYRQTFSKIVLRRYFLEKILYDFITYFTHGYETYSNAPISKKKNIFFFEFFFFYLYLYYFDNIHNIISDILTVYMSKCFTLLHLLNQNTNNDNKQ